MKKIIILLLALALPLFFMAAAKTPAKAPKNTFYKPDFAFPKTVEKNARAIEKEGGAIVILERDCTAERLYQTVNSLLENPARLQEMSRRISRSKRM